MAYCVGNYKEDITLFRVSKDKGEEQRFIIFSHVSSFIFICAAISAIFIIHVMFRGGGGGERKCCGVRVRSRFKRGEMFDLRAIAGSTSRANKLRERSVKSLSRRDTHKSVRSAIAPGYRLSKLRAPKKKCIVHFCVIVPFFCYSHIRKYFGKWKRMCRTREINMLSVYIYIYIY